MHVTDDEDENEYDDVNGMNLHYDDDPYLEVRYPLFNY